MEVQFGPNSIDDSNLLYKLQNKVKVFNTIDPLQNRGYSLVASSSKYGVVFIGVPDGTLTVYYLNQLIDKECEPQHMVVKLQEKPTHIAVSCDQELLAVIGAQLLCIYKITDFQNQNVSPSLSVKTEINASNFVSAMQWNPCIPDSLAIAFYDGTLIAYQLNTAQVKKVQSKARCICWSPKGKQLVTGNSDGSLCQYKPDLSLAKTIPPPNLFEGLPVEALALFWISTFQFAVVYKNATDNSRPAVAIVNAGKTGQLMCLNYEDICFSMGTNRPWYYYLQGLTQWNIILASSSNSMEIATFGSVDGVNWAQWCQPDEARSELPLTDKKLENYPVGLCIDTSALHQLSWGENEVLPHMPLLLVLSQSGLLTIFNIVNLNKQAAQICSPPQQFQLPAAALTNVLSDDTPKPVAVAPAQPTIAQPKPQTPLVQAAPFSLQPVHAANHANLSAISANSQNFQQPQASLGFPVANPEPGQNEIKPVTVPQPQPAVQVKPPSISTTPNLTQVQENTALKAEQERLNKMKANQELKDMLVKEVNDFQMDLYKFMLKTKETQAKLQRDIESINANFNLNSMDTEQLKKECSLDDLRTAVVHLKLELVRACAVVAEARTHADAKDLQQWTQADPLTTKRVASVKKLAYYVQTQLEQAQKSLDFKWNELASRDSQFNKPGQRMIRPRLEDVYQPLVKQQEILGRQQAVLRTLRNTLKECEFAPIFNSTSMLRSTPFRNKDPLTKLTKNILNMSIDPQNKTRETLLTHQKIDALRDMLSNHKIIKIKPINVELRHHLALIRKKYDDSMKEKALPQLPISAKTESHALKPDVKTLPPPMNITKVESKTEVVKPVPTMVSCYGKPVINIKPISSFGNVTRTLFADEPNQEITKPLIQPVPQIQQQQATKPAQSLGFAPFNSTTASAATRSVLKDLLQNKSQANVETKNDTNTFMGQNICSPSAFSYKSASAGTHSATNIFTAKPISDINNMVNKFQPQTFVPQTRPNQAPLNPKSNETGEPEGAQVAKPIEGKNVEISVAKAFPTNTTIPSATSTSNVPDVLKSHQQELAKSENNISLKVTGKKDKTKENIPEEAKVNQKIVPDVKENIAKPLSMLPTTKPNLSISNTTQNLSNNNPSVLSGNSQKIEDTEIQHGDKIGNEKSELTISRASSIFAAANISVSTVPSPQSIAVPTAICPVVSKLDADIITKSATPSDLVKSDIGPVAPKSSTSEREIKPSSSSIFATAVASQPKPTSPTGSIFSTSTDSSTSSFFSSATPGSIFGSSNSVFVSAAQSTFTNEPSKPSVFSTPRPVSPSSVFEAETTQPEPSVFRSTTQTTAFTTPTSQSVFSSSTASTFDTPTKTEASVFTTTTSSLFGTTSTSPQSSVFKMAVTTTSTFSPATTAASIFASTTTTTQSMFGTTPTTQASLFGDSVGQTSVFGSTSPASQSVFGAPSTQTSVFGTPTQSTQFSVFGTPTQTTQSSVFGTPTQTTQSSVFGTPNTLVSVFGTPTQTTQASVFGTPTTNVQSGTLFGGAEADIFASASISPTNASQSSTGNIFGGSTSSASVFGNNNANVFGGKTTFGQSNPTSASIFGGEASFTQKPANSIWGSANTNAGTGFGQQATTQASSIFTNSQGGSFSSPQPSGQAFGSPQQNTTFGGGENKPSVFSSPQQSGSAFGGPSAFGGKSVFGQPASYSSPAGGGFGAFGGFNKSPTSGFGAPATFSGSPTFGGSAFGGSSPGKAFGGTSPAPNFAQTTSNATFESLATQNTLTFGNLAQQSGQQPQQPPSFNTAPLFTGWRG